MIEQITIPAELEAARTYARQRYNAEQPATIVVDGEEVSNPALFATDSAYFTQRVFDMLNSWEKQRQQSLVVPVDPTPVPVGGVPQSVTRKQAVAALILSGKYETVLAAIAAIPDATQRALTQNAFDNATTFDRHDPFTLSLAAAIELSDEDIDALFVAASKL